MTVKTRITLFIVGTGFIASLLFSVVVFYELIEQPFELLDNVLKEEAYRTVNMIVKEQQESDSTHVDALSWSLNRYWIEVSDKETHRVLFRSALAKRVKLSPVEPGSSAIASTIIPRDAVDLDQDKSNEVTFRVRTFRITLNGGTFLVQIARPMEKLEEEIWELVLGIFSGLVFSTLVLIALSRFVAGKILRPIGQMNDLAKTISEKNLDQRIPTGEGRDEFSELAKTINEMMDRLQNSFMMQREFLFDTSHELKTPLTSMRLAVDEILASDREDLHSIPRDNLQRLRSQVLRMERLVKDLLNLSALETLTEVETNLVQITSVLSSLAEEYRFLAEANNITMDVRIPERLVVHGDAEKLRRAFSNILDNAVKYNVERGRIELTADQSPVELTVTVANTGPDVPEAEISKVFDQFYRVEKSRSIEHGGSGLGLAIVKKIVELHRGKVKFESQQKGWARITVSLPRHRENIPV
ncbi:MAG: HAMP domain-containing sensor histidine kinase [Thermodesulfobacteriota bacterium]|nr:HAMP domain-containing sensor histidine kinase [Thermodesulfobacteriota bacterium]